MHLMDHHALTSLLPLLPIEDDYKCLLRLACDARRNVSLAIRNPGQCSLQFLLHTQDEENYFVDVPFTFTMEIRRWATHHGVTLVNKRGIHNPWDVVFTTTKQCSVRGYTDHQGKVTMGRQYPVIYISDTPSLMIRPNLSRASISQELTTHEATTSRHG